LKNQVVSTSEGGMSYQESTTGPEGARALAVGSVFNNKA